MHQTTKVFLDFVPSIYSCRLRYLLAENTLMTDLFYRAFDSVVLEEAEDGGLKVFAYKKVSQKVRPVPTDLPEEYRIVRRRHPDPLKGMPELPKRPVPFEPTGKLDEERIESLELNPDGFLWPEEENLVINLMMLQEGAFAWTEGERGTFDPLYFDPVRIPTVQHVPWVRKNIPIPPGILKRTIELLREKIKAGVLEESNSSYRSRWFCVVKKDGVSLRFVIDLQDLNGVSIRDSAVPPNIETLVDSCGGRSCYTVLDLAVAFDQRALDERSRDLTTIQMPLGTYRLKVLPMGYTNSLQIMHGDITFILNEEIPDTALPYADDVIVKGGFTRYELESGMFETLPENPGIRRFVYEHLTDVNRVLQRVKVVGGTFSGKKFQACASAAVFLGNKLTYSGREPDDSKVQRVRDWPPCKSLTEVRSFLGTVGVLRVFIRGYSMMARPLTYLTRKNQHFKWEGEEQESMQQLKDAVLKCSALTAIDYEADRDVVLAVDSSIIGVGWTLGQEHPDGKRRINRFGSINWSPVQVSYSQPKVELFGLFRALRSVRLFIYGVKQLVVEMDAAYVKGMINNPDLQPNATINRWIAGILLFDFELRHVPVAEFTCTDGLSRRPAAPEDPVEEDDFEEWIDEAYAFVMIGYRGLDRSRYSPKVGREGRKGLLTMGVFAIEEEGLGEVFPGTDEEAGCEKRLGWVKRFLTEGKRPENLDEARYRTFVRYASGFFVKNDRLWKKTKRESPQLVVDPKRRWVLVREAHDSLGHKGVYAV